MLLSKHCRSDYAKRFLTRVTGQLLIDKNEDFLDATWHNFVIETNSVRAIVIVVNKYQINKMFRLLGLMYNSRLLSTALRMN